MSYEGLRQFLFKQGKRIRFSAFHLESEKGKRSIKSWKSCRIKSLWLLKHESSDGAGLDVYG